MAAPGYGRPITVIFMDVLIFGALTGFLVIIRSLLLPVIDFFAPGLRVWYTDTPYVLLAFTVFFVFPLSMLRNISRLEFTSFLAVAIIIAFTGILSYQGIKKIHDHQIPWEQLKWAPKGKDVVDSIFNSLPIIALAYTCQLSVFPIWRELEDPTVRRMNIVNNVTMGLSFLLYIAMGFFGYCLYPIGTKSNIIEMLPIDLMSTVLRIIFIVAILFHYPVVHFAFRNSLEMTLFKDSEWSWVRHTCITCGVVAASLGCAVLPINLGQVFNLTGSVAAFPINFIIPAACYIKLKYYTYETADDQEANPTMLLNPDGSYQTPKFTFRSMLRMGVLIPMFIIFISIIFMVLGIYVSIKDFLPKPKH